MCNIPCNRKCDKSHNVPDGEHYSPRKGSGIYMYVRRVPKAVASLDRRGMIRVSLGTTDVAEASLKAKKMDQANEAYWSALLLGEDQKTSWEKYEAGMAAVHAMGFQYRSMAQLTTVGGMELLARAEVAVQNIGAPLVVDAVLGDLKEPPLRFSGMRDVYLRNMKVALSGLSPNQLRKHVEARDRAIKSLIAVLGDLELAFVSVADVLKYRDHWADRVLAGKVEANTAGREFSNIKGMFSAIDDELKVKYRPVWDALKIKTKGRKTKARTRPPFKPEFVQSKLLAPRALDGLNKEARLVVYLMVETGLRLSEACNLRAEDIRLSAKIPHVAIEERVDREQKTPYSVRTVPLVGVSLWAMKQAPMGFPRYIDKGDTLSGTINSWLRDHGLLPTPKHTVYCLRHTFQDRILAAKAPDRLQTDLMGHEFDREEYGEGSSLEQKLELLDAIKFDWEAEAK